MKERPCVVLVACEFHSRRAMKKGTARGGRSVQPAQAVRPPCMCGPTPSTSPWCWPGRVGHRRRAGAPLPFFNAKREIDPQRNVCALLSLILNAGAPRAVAGRVGKREDKASWDGLRPRIGRNRERERGARRVRPAKAFVRPAKQEVRGGRARPPPLSELFSDTLSLPARGRCHLHNEGPEPACGHLSVRQPGGRGGYVRVGPGRGH